MKRKVALAAAVLLQSGTQPAIAEEEVSLQVLLPKLAVSAERFESTFQRATFSVEGHMEFVDREGKGSDRREGKARVHGDGKRFTIDVIHYTEDGEDRTAQAREKADESRKEEPDPDDDAHLPFLGTEQPRYSFRLREKDLLDRRRVRIEFTPKEPHRLRAVGSAWVDSRTGEFLSIGFVPSKKGMFVDYLRVTMEFAARMGDGPGISRISVEGSGGLLFFHRRYRGVMRFSDYVVR